MMQIKFNFNNFARVCHGLAACQRHTPSSLAAVIGLSNNDVISLRSLRTLRASFRKFVNSLRALRWLETRLKSKSEVSHRGVARNLIRVGINVN